MFWPTAHFSSVENQKASFGGFLACTLVIACGLATLETSANSYAVVSYLVSCRVLNIYV